MTRLRIVRTSEWVKPDEPVVRYTGGYGTPPLPVLKHTDHLQMEDEEGNWIPVPIVVSPIPPRPEHKPVSTPSLRDVFPLSFRTPPPIPDMVYWSAASEEFCSASSRLSMGIQFYLEWRARYDEFPTHPDHWTKNAKT